MLDSISCPNCEAKLRVREEMAGKSVKCPRCAETITVPTRDAVTDTPRPPTDKAGTEVEPENDVATVEPDDEDSRPERPRSKYQPCPECGARGARRVPWTFWGSHIGPRLFHHVRCRECGYAYNGMTGGSNMLWAAIFLTIPALAILAIIAVTVYLILSRLDMI